MFEKRLKAADLAKGTKIPPSIISRYLSGKNQPSTSYIMTIANYLGVQPQSLLSSSDAPESTKKNQVSATEPLLKQIEDKIKIIELLEQMVADKDKIVADKGKQIAWLSQSCDALADEVRRLEAQVGMLKAQNDQWKARGQDRHAKGREKTKKPTKPNKQKVGFMKKHKPKK
jgi:transcriptional regulator with XRE-family HTH domain